VSGVRRRRGAPFLRQDPLGPEELRAAAAKSNEAAAKLAPRVQWHESYVGDDRTFCAYFAENVAAVREHAKLAGLPADRIIEVPKLIDPATAN
jgi:hypothetical protein